MDSSFQLNRKLFGKLRSSDDYCEFWLHRRHLRRSHNASNSNSAGENSNILLARDYAHSQLWFAGSVRVREYRHAIDIAFLDSSNDDVLACGSHISGVFSFILKGS